MAGAGIKDASEIEKEKARAKRALRRELALDEDGSKKDRPLSPLAQKKRNLRKKRIKQTGYLALFILFSYGLWWMLKPYQSDLRYGICKVFIELQVPYPYTIHYSEVISFSDSVRVWYSYLDSFGDYRLVPTQCYYEPHPQYGWALARVTTGRRQIDPDVIDRFNVSIPTIVMNPPDLVFPTQLPRDPSKLKFDFDAYRKKIL